MKTKSLEEVIEKIKRTPEIDDSIARKIIIWFLMKSENLTKTIATSIYTSGSTDMRMFDSLAAEVSYSIDRINRKDGKTKLSELLDLKSIYMYLTYRSGMYYLAGALPIFFEGDVSKGRLNKHPLTLFFSSDSFDGKAELISFDLDEVNSIEL